MQRMSFSRPCARESTWLRPTRRCWHSSCPRYVPSSVSNLRLHEAAAPVLLSIFVYSSHTPILLFTVIGFWLLAYPPVFTSICLFRISLEYFSSSTVSCNLC